MEDSPQGGSGQQQPEPQLLPAPARLLASASPVPQLDWASLLLPRVPGSLHDVGATSSQQQEMAGASGCSSRTAGDGDGETEAGEKSGGGTKGDKKTTKKKKVSRPRFAFQTRSENDILNDGYRWRKYGQKSVKNSAYPRFKYFPLSVSIYNAMKSE